MTPEDPVTLLARERGRRLGELGVRPEDEKWIHREASTLASLVEPARRRGALARWFYRFARKAAWTAR